MSWMRATAPLVSKGGIHALTVALASELALEGIRVNCVAPGFTRTPLMGGADEKRLSGSALLGRIGDVRDIASAVRYLAEASFVTGQILNIDGGYVIGRR
jgi:NAD(P)-dependent dehydrogenase (short-subunit alcohol dehydrogenase family)